MILINLLPHREMARQAARRAYSGNLGAAAIVGALLAGAGYLWFQHQIDQQQQRNSYLSGEIKILDEQIKEVARIEEEIEALRARQEAVEALQQDRNLPVHLLNEAVSQLPNGVYLKSIQQQNRNVLIAGVAQSNERVSELLRNLSRSSEWMTKPELIEIVAGNVDLSEREKRRVYNFTIRVQLGHTDTAEEDDT